MGLLIAYIICLVIGQTITVTIGLAVDRLYSPVASLPLSIVLYFAMFWIAWKIAIRITEPKSVSPSPPPG
jgi:heme A synthase